MLTAKLPPPRGKHQTLNHHKGCGGGRARRTVSAGLLGFPLPLHTFMGRKGILPQGANWENGRREGRVGERCGETPSEPVLGFPSQNQPAD